MSRMTRGPLIPPIVLYLSLGLIELMRGSSIAVGAMVGRQRTVGSWETYQCCTRVCNSTQTSIAWRVATADASTSTNDHGWMQWRETGMRSSPSEHKDQLRDGIWRRSSSQKLLPNRSWPKRHSCQDFRSLSITTTSIWHNFLPTQHGSLASKASSSQTARGEAMNEATCNLQLAQQWHRPVGSALL